MTASDVAIPLQHIVNKHLAIFYSVYKNCEHLVHKENVQTACGTFKLQCGPYWSFVLEDETYKLPCILVDRVGNVKKLTEMNGCLVKINSGDIIIECYKTVSQPQLRISLQFSPSEMSLLKWKHSPSWVMPFPTVKSVRIVHVTSPIIVDKLTAFCLILASVGNKENQCLWILLKDKQVLWHNFLIPNRQYVFNMVESHDYLEKNAKPLRSVLASVKGIALFREVLHHPELWPTMMAVEMPNMTSISMCTSKDTGDFVCRFSSAWWQSVSEVLVYNKSVITSLWGEVINVIHRETDHRDGCSLCAKQNGKQCRSTATHHPEMEKQSWTNPWETGFKTDVLMELPDVYECPDAICTEFTPDNLTKIVTLKDAQSEDTVSLYIKNQSFHQNQSVFTCGTVLAAKFLHKRLSGAGRAYLVSTALSSFEVLGSSSKVREYTNSIDCGFPYKSVEPKTILWGILDMWTLVKVQLSFKNTYRPASRFSDKTLSGKNNFTATAIVQVNRYSGSHVCVILKNDQVKVFLQIPDDIWQNFVTVCRTVSLSYSYKDEISHNRKCLSEMFKTLCAVRNSVKKPFSVSCKLLPRIQDQNDMYICTNIEETDPRRYLNLSKPGNTTSETPMIL